MARKAEILKELFTSLEEKSSEETQPTHVNALTNGNGHVRPDYHSVDYSQVAAHLPVPTTHTNGRQRRSRHAAEEEALKVNVAATLELWRRRQAWHRAEKALTLAGKSLCRRLCGGDKTEGSNLYEAVLKDKEHALKTEATLACGPLVAAYHQINAARKQVEKQLERIAKELPGYEFVTNTPGLSAFTLYALTAECAGVNYRGFLDFDTISRVYKRMSVHCLPDGSRARLLPGVNAVEAGYAPKRRSVLWTIGDSAIKPAGPYREMYLALKAKEVEKAEEKGLKVVPSANIPKKNREGYMSQAHVHNRAKRLTEKEILRALWRHVRQQFHLPVNPLRRDRPSQQQEVPVEATESVAAVAE